MISYPREQTEWIIRNLIDLRQGIWPDPEPHVVLPIQKTGGHNAPFETPAGMAGEIERRLFKCGIEGTMVKVHFILGEPPIVLADIARCSIRDVDRIIERVIDYVSFKEKERTYLDFKGHWWQGYSKSKFPYNKGG